MRRKFRSVWSLRGAIWIGPEAILIYADRFADASGISLPKIKSICELQEYNHC